MNTLSAIGLVEVVVPDLGDIKDVPVIEVLAKVGDLVSVDQTLVVIETEKATMEVPSTHAGVIREVMVKLGDKISCGTLLVMVEPMDAEVRQPEKLPAGVPPPPPPVIELPIARASHTAMEPGPMEAAASAAGKMPHASPSVRRFAREFGLDLSKVSGSGPKGRILHSDLQVFVRNAVSQPQASTVTAGVGLGLDLLPWPQVDFAKFGPIERVELSKIKKISGANLMRNAIVIPHVTNFDEVDITDLETFRVAANKEDGGKGAKLTMLAS